MSNQMSSSKSRRKGALLATIAGAVATPIIAHGQSLTVGAYLSPYGSVPAVNNYIDPYDPVNVYIYATVTGTTSPSVAYSDGLQYLYFNVNGAYTGQAGLGSFTSQLSANFSGGSYNGTPVVPGAGAQNGTAGTLTSTPGIVLGSSSDITQMVKPRSLQSFFSTGTNSSDGKSVIVSGNSVSFLVDTITYQPNATAINNYFSSVTPAVAAANPNTVSFNVSVPSISALAGNNYQGSNYFVGVNTSSGLANQGIVGSAGSANTSNSYLSTGTTVSLTDALPGDINLDGTVDITDFGILNGNFNKPLSGWSNGDLNQDNSVDITDFGILNTYFNKGFAAGAPANLASFSGEIAAGLSLPGGASSVPEPLSGSFLAFASCAFLLGRRKVSKI